METNISFSILGSQANIVDKWSKTHSYLCGLGQTFAYVKRASNDPYLVCMGAELTGIHKLLNRQHPGLGGYHIGSVGVHKNEAIIKAIGELHERYSQLIAEYIVRDPFKIASLNELKSFNEPILSNNQLDFFTPEQYTKNFPFKPYNQEQKLGWYRLTHASDKNQLLWIPGQLLFIGYVLKRDCHEPWLNVAVTTGTATHSNKAQAKLNAILELIQMDCAIGHWYTNSIAKRIEFDDRLDALKRILKKYGSKFSEHINFYFLESPEDWSSFNIACVYRNKNGYFPQVAIGLGADFSLERAMYKAFLECYGVVVMLRYELLYFNKEDFKPDQCYDIDSNICYHALGFYIDFIDEKFPYNNSIKASQIKNDVPVSTPSEQVEFFVRELDSRNKALYECDITTPEAEAVGFCNYRLWSPDLLPLCFPSAPWKNHYRFKEYGGITHELLHPYP